MERLDRDKKNMGLRKKCDVTKFKKSLFSDEYDRKIEKPVMHKDAKIILRKKRRVARLTESLLY